jgi:hypothetical protein
MFGDGDQHRIEKEQLLRRGLPAGEQKKEILGEADVPDELAAKIVAAHDDTVGLDKRDG